MFDFKILEDACDFTNNTQAALLLGGTILAGIASLAYYDKSTLKCPTPTTTTTTTSNTSNNSNTSNTSNTSSSSSSSVPLATKNYLLSVCANYPDNLPLLNNLLLSSTAQSSTVEQQRKVLTEFKYFILSQCFFVNTFNTFTFNNEQSIIDSSGDVAKLFAFMSLVCYELQAKKVLK